MDDSRCSYCGTPLDDPYFLANGMHTAEHCREYLRAALNAANRELAFQKIASAYKMEGWERLDLETLIKNEHELYRQATERAEKAEAELDALREATYEDCTECQVEIERRKKHQARKKP